MNRDDVREEMLWVTQRKIGKKLRIAVVGDLESVIDRVLTRSHARRRSRRRFEPMRGAQAGCAARPLRESQERRRRRLPVLCMNTGGPCWTRTNDQGIMSPLL